MGLPAKNDEDVIDLIDSPLVQTGQDVLTLVSPPPEVKKKRGRPPKNPEEKQAVRVFDLSNPEIKELLRSHVMGLEELIRERININDSISSAFERAKNVGFNPKALRAILELRRTPQFQVEELDGLVHQYKQALGMS